MLTSIVLGSLILCQAQARIATVAYAAVKATVAPQLSENYLAAAMQLLQYYSEMLPYEFEGPTTTRRPIDQEDEMQQPTTTRKPVTTTSTTVKPTRPHKPGYYRPEKPPHARSSGRNIAPLSREGRIYEDAYLQFLPKIHRDLHLQVNERSRDVFKYEDYDEKDYEVIGNLLKNYDEYDDTEEAFGENFSFLKKKRIPPTKAYVEMLMLYDLMKRDAKSQNLQNFNGYSTEMLEDLAYSARGTAADQLRHVLTQMLERNQAKRPDVIARSKTMATDLANPSSALSRAIMYYEPLQFLK